MPMNPVRKFHTADHGPVPPAFFALTLQKYCVLFVNPLTNLRESVIVESLTINILNRESVESWTLYVTAVATRYQTRLSDNPCPVELLGGLKRIGAAGGGTTKVQMLVTVPPVLVVGVGEKTIGVGVVTVEVGLVIVPTVLETGEGALVFPHVLPLLSSFTMNISVPTVTKFADCPATIEPPSVVRMMNLP